MQLQNCDENWPCSSVPLALRSANAWFVNTLQARGLVKWLCSKKASPCPVNTQRHMRATHRHQVRPPNTCCATRGLPPCAGVAPLPGSRETWMLENMDATSLLYHKLGRTAHVHCSSFTKSSSSTSTYFQPSGSVVARILVPMPGTGPAKEAVRRATKRTSSYVTQLACDDVKVEWYYAKRAQSFQTFHHHHHSACLAQHSLL